MNEQEVNKEPKRFDAEAETLADLPVTESNPEFVTGGTLLRDGSHGTHVAGTIGAVGNNGVG